MPTAADFQELYDNCTSVWTTLNGVNGRLFTSNVNGHTLFFPAAGGYDGTTLYTRGSRGHYFSSTIDSGTYAKVLLFRSSQVEPQSYDDRRLGFTIRAVKDGTPNRSTVPPSPEDEPKEEETQTEEEPKDDNQR